VAADDHKCEQEKEARPKCGKRGPYKKLGSCIHCEHPIGYHHLEGDRCSVKYCESPGYEGFKIQLRHCRMRSLNKSIVQLQGFSSVLPVPTFAHIASQHEDWVSHSYACGQHLPIPQFERKGRRSDKAYRPKTAAKWNVSLWG
jgi:hypothetical protein